MRHDVCLEAVGNEVVQLLERHMLCRGRTEGELFLRVLVLESGFLVDLFLVLTLFLVLMLFLVLTLLAAQRLDMRGTSVGLLWRGDTVAVADVASWCNTGHGGKATALRHRKDHSAFLDLFHTLGFFSAKCLQIPWTWWKRRHHRRKRTLLVIEERSDARARTTDRTSVRCCHDRIPSVGVPTREQMFEEHGQRNTFGLRFVCNQKE